MHEENETVHEQFKNYALEAIDDLKSEYAQEAYSNAFWYMYGARPQINEDEDKGRLALGIAQMMLEVRTQPETAFMLLTTDWKNVSDEELPWGVQE